MSSRIQVLLLVLLFGAGVLLGHLLTARSADARTATEARADSLIGALSRAHQVRVRELQDSAAAARARADSAAARAQLLEAGWSTRDATMDSLREVGDSIDRALQAAASAADSVPGLVAKVRLREEERDSARQALGEARAAAADWKQSYQEMVVAAGELEAKAREDSARIEQLEGVVRDLRKPARWTLRLGRFELKLCAQYQVAKVGRVSTGPTACLAPPIHSPEDVRTALVRQATQPSMRGGEQDG